MVQQIFEYESVSDSELDFGFVALHLACVLPTSHSWTFGNGKHIGTLQSLAPTETMVGSVMGIRVKMQTSVSRPACLKNILTKIIPLKDSMCIVMHLYF